MRDVITELKALRLHGMAATWAELGEQNSDELGRSRWLIEHMLKAEASDRTTRSVSHQMSTAKFPVHRDLAGFDFDVSPVDRKLVTQLASCEFTVAAHNAVLVGGPGTGKSHLATAIGLDTEPLSVWRKSHTHLSVVIHRIRQKVPEGSILNRRGFGFRVDADNLFGGDLV